jgi:hypothetical protein
MASSNLVLRTVYLSPSVDDKLRDQAYYTRTSKNDLIRRYIEAGMKALAGQVVGVTAAAKKAPAKQVGQLAAKKAAAGYFVAKKAAPAKKAAAKTVLAAKKAAPAKKAAAKKAPAKKMAARAPRP